MSFAPMRTGVTTMSAAHKVLVYAHAGWGKTYQARHFKRKWGNGFIVSGESGLRTLGAEEVDFLPFTSWDGKHDYSEKVFSFLGLVRDMSSPEFQKQDYKWVMVDSLTEVSDRLMEHLQEKHKNNKNRFELWQDYATQMIGVLKIIRDLPHHVVMTALLKSDTDDNSVTTHSPAIKGNAVAQQLCGIMDHVIAGVRVTEEKPGEDGKKIVKVRRFCVVDEAKGYIAKVRDPYQRFAEKPIVPCADVTDILEVISMAPERYAAYEAKRKEANAIADAAIAEASK